jgi:lysophospholipase L1-like esterase
MRSRPSVLAAAAAGVAAVLAAALTLLAPPATAVPESGPVGPPQATGWYLALGDSLANGFLNGSGDHPGAGYVGPVLDSLRETAPRTKLVNLACSGETTTTLLDGGRCDYEEGSQLDEAVEFLHAHRGFTRLVTIDIGGNDIAPCGFQGLPPTCVARGLATIGANLPVILDRLRAAAGPDVQIVVLNYYDPFLALWLLDTPGTSDDDFYRDLAVASVDLLTADDGVNGLIESAAGAIDADVADVETAFSTLAFEPPVPLPGHDEVPLNVARICMWTTMCTHLDFHPNPAGYGVMAEAVGSVLD